MAEFKYASTNEAIIYESVSGGKGKNPISRVLMGTYVKIISENDEWTQIYAFKKNGWMRSSDLSNDMGMKIFFLDVGQGDGTLLEVGKYKIVIDAGPNSSMYNYLTKWQYKYLLDKGEKVHIDFLIVSHFDTDHYKGFVKILQDKRFTFGTIVHAGILKFAVKDNPYNSGLGEIVSSNGKKYLTKVFDDLLTVSEQVSFNRDVTAFLNALHDADIQGVKRFEQGDIIIEEQIESQSFRIEVLAPFTEKLNDEKAFVYWKDDGKTINGHSLVLKVVFGNRTVLLGGDLNTFSQHYLMEKYPFENPFEVDVAKSCHHGSSDFSEKFMELVNPYATVISSGDNEGHAHPRADAIGCAGKYSKSKRPLVYSTELARSTDLKNQKILYGMINLRTNGKDIYMSQMKEVKNNSDLWDSYEVK